MRLLATATKQYDTLTVTTAMSQGLFLGQQNTSGGIT